MLCVFAVTAFLRLFHLTQSYDVFLDESTYTRISAGAAVDGRLIFGQFFFYLHGPLSFYFQAGLIRLFSIGGAAISVIHQLRVFNALVGAATATALFVAVSIVTRSGYGAVAFLLFALDPFIISFDSRLFLETFVTVWVVLGYLVLVAATPERGEMRTRWSVLAGFMFGLAMLSKETSVSLYFAPLLWCVCRGSPIGRPAALRTLGVTIVTYAPYPIIAFATGGASQFVQQKFNGVERLLGIIKETGFNRPHAPSLLSRVSADLGTFLPTYILIAAGAVAAVWVCRHGSRRQRVLATWACGASVMLAFQVTQGTIEEQMFYYLVVPAIVMVVAAVASAREGHALARPVTAVAVAAICAILIYDAVTWTSAHTKRDAAMADTVAWISEHVPAGTRVAPLADGVQLLLPDYRLLFSPEAGVVSSRQLRRAGTQLAITSSLQVDQGYSAATRTLVRWLHLHARQLYSATGATAGTVTVWKLARFPTVRPPGPQRLVPRGPISLGAGTIDYNTAAS